MGGGNKTKKKNQNQNQNQNQKKPPEESVNEEVAKCNVDRWVHIWKF